MKAIYIPENFDIVNGIEKLNKELKDAYSIEKCITVNQNFSSMMGNVLIVKEHGRKDKLKKLNKISKKNEGNNI